MNIDFDYLVGQAIKAREAAYTPYSGYNVGAALLAKDGTVFLGCNIESASYSPTNCAERTAFFKAVSEGYKEFLAIAVIGAHKDATAEEFEYFYPCGVCRQVMMEFCVPEEFKIAVARSASDYNIFTLKELLPNGFGPAHLSHKNN